MTRPLFDTVGIVLAGGGSTRLARLVPAPTGGKAGLLFQGRTFLEQAAMTVAAAVGQTIVVAAPGQPLPPLGEARIVRDRTPG